MSSSRHPSRNELADHDDDRDSSALLLDELNYKPTACSRVFPTIRVALLLSHFVNLAQILSFYFNISTCCGKKLTNVVAVAISLPVLGLIITTLNIFHVLSVDGELDLLHVKLTLLYDCLCVLNLVVEMCLMGHVSYFTVYFGIMIGVGSFLYSYLVNFSTDKYGSRLYSAISFPPGFVLVQLVLLIVMFDYIGINMYFISDGAWGSYWQNSANHGTQKHFNSCLNSYSLSSTYHATGGGDIYEYCTYTGNGEDTGGCCSWIT